MTKNLLRERKVQMIKKEEAESILKKYGQEHLLNHYDSLSEVKQKELKGNKPLLEIKAPEDEQMEL